MEFRVAGGPVLSTPLVTGNRVFATGCYCTLHALDLATGKELTQIDVGGQVAASPAVADGKLFVPTMTAELLAIDAEQVDGRLALREPQATSVLRVGAVTEKFVLAAARDGRVYAIDRTTGKDAWTFLAGARIDSSPVVAGTRVYFGSFDKHLYVLDLKGHVVQKIGLDGSIAASPAISGGCVVVGTDKGTGDRPSRRPKPFSLIQPARPDTR